MKTDAGKFYKLCLSGCYRSVCSLPFLFAALLVGVGYYLGVGGRESQICSSLSDLLHEAGYNGDLAVLTVLGSTLPGAAMFCQDYDSGNFMFLAIRGGVKRYGAASMLSCALAGGLANFLGRAVLLLAGWVQGYDGFRVYDRMEIANAEDILYWYTRFQTKEMLWVHVLAVLFCSFCMGMILAAAGMCLSAFLLSPYAAWIFPYALLLADKLLPGCVPVDVRAVPMWMGLSLSGSPAADCLRTIFLTGFYIIAFLLLFLWKLMQRKQSMG